MEWQRLRREREGFSLKKISPDRATLAAWARKLPPAKDQLFLPAAFSPMLAHDLTLEKILPGKPRRHWGLMERSWFGYLANQAAFRIVLPAGKLAALPQSQRRALKNLQIKLKNLALVRSRLLPASLREPEPYTWITAGFFRGLKLDHKQTTLKAWDRTGKFTGIYPRLSVSSLPAGPKRILQERRLLKLVNTFAQHSGPNCFALAAHAISGKNLQDWMHPPDFFKVAERAGLRPVKGKPRPGDILVCRQGKDAVHAALYLGGFVFEKPGQDFYEPYRLAKWNRWLKDWRHTRFEIWRGNA